MGVYITEELLAAMMYSNAMRHSNISKRNRDATAYVVRSLQQEMLRWPKGEDLTQQNKSNVIVGSTINIGLRYPFVFKVNPKGIQTMVPNVNVVAYLRSNKVKQAISLIRADLLNKNCGSKVVTGKCKLDKKTVVTDSDFHKALRLATKFDRYILSIVKEFTHILRRQSRVIWYEDLLAFDDVFEKLLEWLGFNISDFEMQDEFSGRCSLNCTKLVLMTCRM